MLILKLRNILPKDLDVLILSIASVVFMFVFYLIIGEGFFSALNIQTMTFQVPEFGFLSIAMALCMLAGGIDLSVVAIATLSKILAAYVLTGLIHIGVDVTLSILATVLVSLSVAIICGLINGTLIAIMKIRPMLATLSTSIFFIGVSMAITEGVGVVGFPREFLRFGTITLFGIPVIFIMLILTVIIISFVLKHTRYGKELYLYGENKTVSLFSGINDTNLVLKTYMISGLLCGIAGLIIMARVNSARVGYGEIYLLQSILVCILGGLDPKGGKGRLIGVFFAIIMILILRSGFILLAFKPYNITFIWGSVLILIMAAKYYLSKRKNN